MNTVAQGVLGRTGLSQWVGCSNPQGSGRGRESINPAKMKLWPPGCHNLSHLASSTNCLHRFFACGWWSELLESNLQRYSVRLSLFTRSGLWEMTCCSCKTNEHQQQKENQITNTQTRNKTRKPNHKYKNKKQSNQNLGKQTQPRCVKNGCMYIGLRKVWKKDSHARREYHERGMCNVKKKWATVDIRNSMFQHHNICHHMQRWAEGFIAALF